MKKTCSYCSDIYEAKRSTSVYCSDKCRLNANRKIEPNDTLKPIDIDTLTPLDLAFQAYHEQRGRTSWVHFEKLRKSECMDCGKPFETHLALMKFCSLECSPLV